jgi:putative phosphotransacetylase
MSEKDATRLGYGDKQVIAVVCGEARQAIFGNVIIRVGDDYSLDFHIDTDEANAAGVRTGDVGYIVRPTLSYPVPGGWCLG